MHAEAQFNLGVCHRDGLGVPQDMMRAADLFKLAADQGDANAQMSLGAMYANGQGVPQVGLPQCP